MKTLFVAAALGTANPIIPPVMLSPSPEPTVILSGIRNIVCNEGAGSGFVVDVNVLATALHVANLTNCKDRETKKPLQTYYRDEKNDFALMAGEYPVWMKMRYGCEGFKNREDYDSYGISKFYVGEPVFRQYKLTAMEDYTGLDFLVKGRKDEKIPMPGMRHLRGFIVPGLSGGPITNSKTGKVVGINNVAGRFFNYVVNNVYSYELKNTVLCKN